MLACPSNNRINILTGIQLFQHLSTSFNIFQHLSTSFNIFHPFQTEFHHVSPYFTCVPGNCWTLFSASSQLCCSFWSWSAKAWQVHNKFHDDRGGRRAWKQFDYMGGEMRQFNITQLMETSWNIISFTRVFMTWNGKLMDIWWQFT